MVHRCHSEHVDGEWGSACERLGAQECVLHRRHLTNKYEFVVINRVGNFIQEHLIRTCRPTRNPQAVVYLGFSILESVKVMWEVYMKYHA